MSLELYSTGLYWSRHREHCAARLHGGAIVARTAADALAIQWPIDVEHVYYVPETGVRQIQRLGEPQRDMTAEEVKWCDAVLRHLCEPMTERTDP